MNYQNASDFFSTHSLPSILIAFAVAILYFVLDKFLFKKFTFHFKVLIPFLFSIIFYIVYDAIFIGSNPLVSTETLSIGFVTGSISSVIFALLKRIFSKNGLKNLSLSPIALLIESIIYPLMEESKLHIAVNAIESLIASAFILGDDNQAVINDIAKIIGDNADGKVDEPNCSATAKLIVESAESLKKGQNK